MTCHTVIYIVTNNFTTTLYGYFCQMKYRESEKFRKFPQAYNYAGVKLGGMSWLVWILYPCFFPLYFILYNIRTSARTSKFYDTKRAALTKGRP